MFHSNLEKFCFIFRNLLIDFDNLQFTRLLDSIGCAGLILYAIPALVDIYTIDAHSICFQFCSLTAFLSLLEQRYIFTQYLSDIYSTNF